MSVSAESLSPDVPDARTRCKNAASALEFKRALDDEAADVDVEAYCETSSFHSDSARE